MIGYPNTKYIRKAYTRYRLNKVGYYCHTGYKVKVPGFKETRFLGVDYGSMDNALKEAIFYRNDLLEKLDADPNYAGNLRHKKNRTGVVGVINSNGLYICSTYSKGVRTLKSFSVSIYGEEGAFLSAVRERFLSTNKGGFLKRPVSAKLKRL